MKFFKAILTLVRFPNIVFIFITQLLTFHFIIEPAVLLYYSQTSLNNFQIILLSFSTALIAAGGYIINDYFDIGIDAVNKPAKVTIEKIFKRRTIIIWHVVLNIIALLIIIFLVWQKLPLKFITIQLLCILLLIIYSTTYKRKLLIGNVIIAMLASFTILTIAVFEPNFEFYNIHFKHTKLFWMYVIFSFIITLIREIVKDIEDVKGDSTLQCQTIPLTWGIETAKKIIYVLLILLMLLILISAAYFFSFNKMLSIYYMILLFIPLSFLLYKINVSILTADFHQISTYLKLITFLGIISMVLI